MQQKVRVRDPEAIEQALNDLRQASLASTGPGMPPVRATALNLVAYAGDLAAAERMAGWASDLAELHPARAIFLGTEPESTEEYDVWVSAHCRPAATGRVVCFEAVRIMARSQAMERLPAIAMGLLLRDLPAVLWWPGDPPIGTALFERLLANSDHLVVDSAGAADPEALLRRLAALGHAEHCICSTGDMNWDRLTPWRELIAQFFDPADCRPCLERVEEVRLESAVPLGRRDSAQAFLLGGWLATRLGWAPAPEVWSETAEGSRLNLLHGRHPIAIELLEHRAEPGGEGALPGLWGLALRAGHPDGEAAFTIRRTADGARAEVTTQLPRREPRQRIVPFAPPGPVELLGEELRRIGFDPTYGEALRMAAFFSAQRPAPEAAGVRRQGS